MKRCQPFEPEAEPYGPVFRRISPKKSDDVRPVHAAAKNLHIFTINLNPDVPGFCAERIVSRRHPMNGLGNDRIDRFEHAPDESPGIHALRLVEQKKLELMKSP